MNERIAYWVIGIDNQEPGEKGPDKRQWYLINVIPTYFSCNFDVLRLKAVTIRVTTSSLLFLFYRPKEILRVGMS